MPTAPFRTKREKQLEREKGLREEMIAQAKAGVKEALARKDLVLTQAVRTLDDIDSARSLLATRLKEMFSLNFPELELSNEETYAAVAAEFGRREDLKPEKLRELVGEKAQDILVKARKSFGAAFDEADRAAVQELGAKVKALFEARKALQEYLEKEANVTFKNLAYLTDPVLATRLVATAGGLEKLARMPASTVQVLGAERALFKHLRAGTKPPKHGIIFQSSYIRSAPWHQRGKIARDLATKLAIAAKADFYTKNFIAEKLKARFDARLKEIQELPARPEPPRRPEFEGRAPRGPRPFRGPPRGPPRGPRGPGGFRGPHDGGDRPREGGRPFRKFRPRR
jgi:nucleolar protein 56